MKFFWNQKFDGKYPIKKYESGSEMIQFNVYNGIVENEKIHNKAILRQMAEI